MNREQAEKVLSDPDASVENLALAKQVLADTRDSDTPQTPPVPGTAAGSVNTLATPGPSASASNDGVDGASINISSEAAPAQHPFATKDGFFAHLKVRMSVMPHADRTYVQEIHDLFMAVENEVAEDLDLDAMVAKRDALEARVRYILKQLQSDGGHLKALFEDFFRA